MSLFGDTGAWSLAFRRDRDPGGPVVAHDLELLTSDREFHHAARHIPLRLAV